MTVGPSTLSTGCVQDNKQQESTSKGKPKGKSKKKAKEAGGVSEETKSSSELTCTVCGREFPSRNKLFQHIKDSGHAIAMTTGSQAGKKTGKGSKSKRTKNL